MKKLTEKQKKDSIKKLKRVIDVTTSILSQCEKLMSKVSDDKPVNLAKSTSTLQMKTSKVESASIDLIRFSEEI